VATGARAAGVLFVSTILLPIGKDIASRNTTKKGQAMQLMEGYPPLLEVLSTEDVEEFNAHQPWTAGPLTNDGHAVYAVAYDAAGLTVLTWGNTQQATWGWWDECVDEAYAIVPPEAKNPDFAPGFDLAQLQQDLSEVAS
jgi:hypothetical protein